MATQRRSRRGVALLEVVVAVVTLAMLLALLAVAAHSSRRLAGLGHSEANLRQYGVGVAAYANESADRTPTFSWLQGQDVETPYPDVRNAVLAAPNDLAAQAAQAVHIMRLRGNDPTLPLIQAWLPHLLYSHLPLMDFLGEDLALAPVVSPGDRLRLGWRDGTLTPPGHPDPTSRRWEYSSSYEVGPTWFSPEELLAGQQNWPRRLAQANTHNLYLIPANPIFEGRFLSSVAYPSQKVYAFEQVSRFFGPRQVFFAFPEARIPLVMADGSVHTRTMSDANRGWNPQQPTTALSTQMQYAPMAWEPPAPGGASSVIVPGMIRWTRGGGLGRDFGPELPPGP